MSVPFPIYRLNQADQSEENLFDGVLRPDSPVFPSGSLSGRPSPQRTLADQVQFHPDPSSGGSFALTELDAAGVYDLHIGSTRTGIWVRPGDLLPALDLFTAPTAGAGQELDVVVLARQVPRALLLVRDAGGIRWYRPITGASPFGLSTEGLAPCRHRIPLPEDMTGSVVVEIHGQGEDGRAVSAARSVVITPAPSRLLPVAVALTAHEVAPGNEITVQVDVGRSVEAEVLVTVTDEQEGGADPAALRSWWNDRQRAPLASACQLLHRIRDRADPGLIVSQGSCCCGAGIARMHGLVSSGCILTFHELDSFHLGIRERGSSLPKTGEPKS